MDILTFKQSKKSNDNKSFLQFAFKTLQKQQSFSGKCIPYISISLNMKYMINSKRNSKSLCTQH